MRPPRTGSVSIVGVGLEWGDVGRFVRVEERFGARFRSRVFTELEQGYADRFTNPGRSAQALAVRFAAKVAARRALWRAHAQDLTWRDIEVVRGPGGRPGLAFHGPARRAARSLGVSRVSVTLAHDGPQCIGQVILERSG